MKTWVFIFSILWILPIYAEEYTFATILPDVKYIYCDGDQIRPLRFKSIDGIPYVIFEQDGEQIFCPIEFAVCTNCKIPKLVELGFDCNEPDVNYYVEFSVDRFKSKLRINTLTLNKFTFHEDAVATVDSFPMDCQAK